MDCTRTKLSFEWGLLVWIRGLVPKELNVKDLAYETYAPHRLPALACLASALVSHRYTCTYICRWQDGKAMCFLVDKLCGTDSPINMQEVMNVRFFFFSSSSLRLRPALTQCIAV